MSKARNLSASYESAGKAEIPKRALLVGIDQYDQIPGLSCCVADATAMRELLQKNEDGSPNYDCRLLVSSGEEKITRKVLRSQWNKLFGDYKGDLLFFFSGHGAPMRSGGYLVTQEGDLDDPGLAMDELLVLANSSEANSVLLILDCCSAGHLGLPAILQGGGSGHYQAHLREGLTILAASGPTEEAFEVEGQGVFTRLVLGALSGGAADVRGLVSAASIYGYVEQTLGPWQQRPMYKSHADKLQPVRTCRPAVPDPVLRELPILFETPESFLRLDPSYEFTHPSKKRKNVSLFKKFKMLRNARLLMTVDQDDLYFAAMRSGRIGLTPVGQFYWRLAEAGRL